MMPISINISQKFTNSPCFLPILAGQLRKKRTIHLACRISGDLKKQGEGEGFLYLQQIRLGTQAEEIMEQEQDHLMISVRQTVEKEGLIISNLQYQFLKIQMENRYESAQGNPIRDQDQSYHHSSEPSSASHFKIKDGLWSQEEVFKFIAYLYFNKQALKLKLQRRTSKIFKQMAAFIGSRTSVQCRSQNQRLFRKYKHLRNIISSFREDYGQQRFEEDYARIIKNPAIKFKTQYESYVQQQSRNVCEVATQTDQSPTFSPWNLQAFWLFRMGYEYALPTGGNYPNWIIVPFYS